MQTEVTTNEDHNTPGNVEATVVRGQRIVLGRAPLEQLQGVGDEDAMSADDGSAPLRL